MSPGADRDTALDVLKGKATEFLRAEERRRGRGKPKVPKGESGEEDDLLRRLRGSLKAYFDARGLPLSDRVLDAMLQPQRRRRLREAALTHAAGKGGGKLRARRRGKFLQGMGGDVQLAQEALAIFLGVDPKTVLNWTNANKRWQGKHLEYEPSTAFGIQLDDLAKVRALVEALEPYGNKAYRARTEVRLRKVARAIDEAAAIGDQEAEEEFEREAGELGRPVVERDPAHPLGGRGEERPLHLHGKRADAVRAKYKDLENRSKVSKTPTR